jgi:hypothetical protein
MRSAAFRDIALRTAWTVVTAVARAERVGLAMAAAYGWGPFTLDGDGAPG